MFYRAIEKYGWDNITHEIIANNLTKEEAMKFETLLILKLNSHKSKFGYNLSISTTNENTPSGIIAHNYDDLVGKTFDNLLVLEKVNYSSIGHKTSFLCKCLLCGDEKVRKRSTIIDSKRKHCNCQRKNKQHIGDRLLNKYDLSNNYGVGYIKGGEAFYFDLEDYDKIKNYTWRLFKGRILASNLGTSIYINNFLSEVGSNQTCIYLNGNNFDNRKNNLIVVSNSIAKTILGLIKNKDNRYYYITNKDKKFVVGIPKYNVSKLFYSYKEAIFYRNEKLKEIYKDNELLSNLVALFYCNEKEDLNYDC